MLSGAAVHAKGRLRHVTCSTERVALANEAAARVDHPLAAVSHLTRLDQLPTSAGLTQAEGFVPGRRITRVAGVTNGSITRIASTNVYAYVNSSLVEKQSWSSITSTSDAVRPDAAYTVDNAMYTSHALVLQRCCGLRTPRCSARTLVSGALCHVRPDEVGGVLERRLIVRGHRLRHNLNRLVFQPVLHDKPLADQHCCG